MLIIGGIAVPIASLPDWAQHASAFFPGRYAVETLQACVTGEGLGSAMFSVSALLVIGIAGCAAGAMMFRWDEHERFATRRERAWVVVALAAWAAVGVAAEFRGHVATTTAASPASPSTSLPTTDVVIDSPTGPIQTLRATPAEVAAGARPSSAASAAASASPNPEQPRPVASRSHPTSWQAVSQQDVDSDLTFDRLPPDNGVITPIASAAEQPDPSTAESVAALAQALPEWPPGSVADPVQRVRNLLYVAAVPDLLMMDTERYIPAVVYRRIQEQTERSDLIKILYWIALHPFDGEDQAVDDMASLGLPPASATNAEDVRARAAVYGVKLLGRLVGRIEAK
jgi:hypothetical protein